MIKKERLTSMMSKLTAQGNNQNKQFKPKIYQRKRRGQMRNYYDQGYYQNRYRSNSVDWRTSFTGRGKYRQNYRGKPQYVNTYRNEFRKDNFRETQNCIGQNFRGRYRGNYRNNNFGRGRNRCRERQYSGNFRRNDRSSSSRFRLGSRAITNRGMTRCFKCREYDNVTKDYPNLQTNLDNAIVDY